MPKPTCNDVREYLEDYDIDSGELSDKWITKRIDYSIIPLIERAIGYPVEGITQKTDYLSGNGSGLLRLSIMPIDSLVSIAYVHGGDVSSPIGLGSIEVIKEEGLLKATTAITEGGYSTLFAKGDRNIKVVYNVGWTTIPDDLKEAIICLTAEKVLGHIASKTGGGNVSVPGVGRTFGARGKYTELRNELLREAAGLLSKYTSPIVGNIK